MVFPLDTVKITKIKVSHLMGNTENLIAKQITYCRRI